PLKQQALPLPDPGTGGERLDPTALDARLEGEVEIAERLAGGQPRELERGADAALIARRELGFEQRIEKAVRRMRLLRGRRDVLAQPIGRVQEPEPEESLARAIEIDLGQLLRQGRRRGARLARHRATSASAA